MGELNNDDIVLFGNFLQKILDTPRKKLIKEIQKFIYGRKKVNVIGDNDTKDKLFLVVTNKSNFEEKFRIFKSFESVREWLFELGLRDEDLIRVNFKKGVANILNKDHLRAILILVEIE